MTDTLRERVARACAHAVEKQYSDIQAVKALGFESVEAFVDRAWPNYLPQADVAIALVLEEAAKVCEITFDSEMASYGDYFAAAIRALKEGGNE